MQLGTISHTYNTLPRMTCNTGALSVFHPLHLFHLKEEKGVYFLKSKGEIA